MKEKVSYFFTKLVNDRLLAWVIIISAVLVSSCSTSGFLKRKYTKGYYLESIARQRQVEKKQMVSEQFSVDTKQSNISNQHNALTDEQNNKYSDNLLVVENTEKCKTHASIQKFHSVNLKTSNSVSTFQKEYKDKFNFAPITSNILNLKNKNIQVSKPSDKDLIVQVILALIIFTCLIAVYLHDGKKITTNFWVDLILYLTVIGAVIFALLVVLDVVNLA